METTAFRDKRWIILWLFIGVIMVFVQIILGGVTRLTGSGLSITKWDIVTGIIPPLNFTAWNEAFELYKKTPQYQQINKGMMLSQFKFIFLWEYFHRVWARTMGFVFIIPFMFFWYRKSLRSVTIQRLGIVISIALLAAVFGWIMVASGLTERPWVNAYKLTIHLGLGIGLFVFLFYTWVAETGYTHLIMNEKWRKAIHLLIALVILQICFGGFVSGMKSALYYPTWPLMNKEWVPDLIYNKAHWNIENVLLYDTSGFMPALVMFVHRNIAFVIVVFVIVFSHKWMSSQNKNTHWVAYSLFGIVVVQVLLGILTLLNSTGSVPVFYGVLHQGLGILFITALFYIKIRTGKKYI